jgi:hypothetical protein
VKYIGRMAQALFRGGAQTNLGQLAEDTAPKYQLCGIISTLLKCVELIRPDGHLVERNRFWSYVLFCAALKEFEYSCRSTEEDLIKEILKQAEEPIYKLESRAIWALINGVQKLEHTFDSIAFCNYFRHFTAARLLRGIIVPEVMTTTYKSRSKERDGNG